MEDFGLKDIVEIVTNPISIIGHKLGLLAIVIVPRCLHIYSAVGIEPLIVEDREYYYLAPTTIPDTLLRELIMENTEPSKICKFLQAWLRVLLEDDEALRDLVKKLQDEGKNDTVMLLLRWVREDAKQEQEAMRL